MDNLLYKKISEANEPRIMEHFHGSSIAECPRSHYFKRLGVPPVSTPGAGKMLRWQVGHLVEEAIRPYLKQLYPNLVSNVRFTNEELDLTGEVDNYNPDEKEIIEIKSVGPRAIAYKKVADTRHHLRDQKPYLSHELQQHAYVTLMHTNGQRYEVNLPANKPNWQPPSWDVEKITYLYISLEGLIVPYTTQVKPELLENVSKRLQMLNEAWASKTVPECICKPEHPLWGSTMQFCDYRNNTEAPGIKCCDLSLIKEK